MADIKKMIEDVKSMTVVELNELVKALEEEFGVSAAAMAVAAPAAGGAAAPAAEEKSEFTIHLTEVGANKIAVIKVVREVTGLGLAEAKAVVDKAPSLVKENVAKEQAELEQQSAKIEFTENDNYEMGMDYQRDLRKSIEEDLSINSSESSIEAASSSTTTTSSYSTPVTSLDDTTRWAEREAMKMPGAKTINIKETE